MTLPFAGIQRIAELIEDGDRGRADLYAVLLGLPQISPEGMAKLTTAWDLKKGGAGWENEPRIAAGAEAAGEWTGENGVGSEAHLEPAACRTRIGVSRGSIQGHVLCVPAVQPAMLSMPLLPAVARRPAADPA